MFRPLLKSQASDTSVMESTIPSTRAREIQSVFDESDQRSATASKRPRTSTSTDIHNRTHGNRTNANGTVEPKTSGALTSVSSTSLLRHGHKEAEHHSWPRFSQPHGYPATDHDSNEMRIPVKNIACRACALFDKGTTLMWDEESRGFLVECNDELQLVPSKEQVVCIGAAESKTWIESADKSVLAVQVKGETTATSNGVIILEFCSLQDLRACFNYLHYVTGEQIRYCSSTAKEMQNAIKAQIPIITAEHAALRVAARTEHSIETTFAPPHAAKVEDTTEKVSSFFDEMMASLETEQKRKTEEFNGIGARLRSYKESHEKLAKDIEDRERQAKRVEQDAVSVRSENEMLRQQVDSLEERVTDLGVVKQMAGSVAKEFKWMTQENHGKAGKLMDDLREILG